MSQDPEELWVARWLRQATVEAPPRSLPSASHLWWKARIIRQLVERDALAEKAARPAFWSQWIGLAVLSLAAALLLTLFGGGLLGDAGLLSAAAGASPWRWVLALLLVGAVLPALGLGALWVLWREA